MRLFQITDFQLENPISIIARDKDHAAEMFIMSFVRSIGNIPTASYGVNELILTGLADDPSLFNLTMGHQPGFAWSSADGGWELFDPYQEW